MTITTSKPDQNYYLNITKSYGITELDVKMNKLRELFWRIFTVFVLAVALLFVRAILLFCLMVPTLSYLSYFNVFHYYYVLIWLYLHVWAAPVHSLKVLIPPQYFYIYSTPWVRESLLSVDEHLTNFNIKPPMFSFFQSWEMHLVFLISHGAFSLRTRIAVKETINGRRQRFQATVKSDETLAEIKNSHLKTRLLFPHNWI